MTTTNGKKSFSIWSSSLPVIAVVAAFLIMLALVILANDRHKAARIEWAQEHGNIIK